MPLVDQATFNHLLKHQAIAETGEVIYTIKHDGQSFPPGSEKFFVTQEIATKPPQKAVTPTPVRTPRATKETEKEGKVNDAG